MEAAGIGHERYALSDGQLSARTLSFNGFVTAHFLSKPFAPAKVFNRFFPTHVSQLDADRTDRSSHAIASSANVETLSSSEQNKVSGGKMQRRTFFLA
ncbi:MAG: hypothetical protein AAFY37_09225 [Pseudomonadota bacterium]